MLQQFPTQSTSVKFETILFREKTIDTVVRTQFFRIRIGTHMCMLSFDACGSRVHVQRPTCIDRRPMLKEEPIILVVVYVTYESC